MFLSLSIFTPTTSAFSLESQADTLLATTGLTEKQFEKKVKQYVGVPYRKGGRSSKGLDCSGFVSMVYDRHFGIELPHNSRELYLFTKLQKIAKTGMQAGDLLFFSNRKTKRINHVGVYLSHGQFIHASTSQGIMVSKLKDQYWGKRFVGSKRYISLSD